MISKKTRNLITDVHEASARLRPISDLEMRMKVDEIRCNLMASQGRKSPEAVVEIMAFAKEAIRRQIGIDLYDTQLLAGQALIQGDIAEMQTGEGKTFAAVAAAVYGAVHGNGVHVATPTPYLAERDYEELKPVYESLGLSVGILNSHESCDKRNAYDADITYGPGYEFGFDYLRDQVLLKRSYYSKLGQSLLDSLVSPANAGECTVNRGHAFAIVDEADHVLIDDASSPMVLSEVETGAAPDEDAIALAHAIAQRLEAETDFVEPEPRHLQLTSAGRKRVHRSDVTIPFANLIRPWTEYVEAALRAVHQFKVDVDYVVSNEQILIVDETTGRIFEDRTWQSGLHQAIEAKEGVPITPEKLPIARITRQRFYGLYNHVCGMTGTADNCGQELKTIYELGITKIPLRQPSNRIQLPLRAFVSSAHKWAAIGSQIIQINQQRRPILIGTRTIAESQLLASVLEGVGLEFQMLNGKQNLEEAEIIANAGHLGRITIATNLAGRGTDIKLAAGVNELGGLHVIVSECHDSQRVDRQLIGRSARQGNHGSAQIFISAEDWLLQVHGQWLSDSIRKLAVNGEVHVDLTLAVQKLQRSVERKSLMDRLEMFEQSKQFDSIWEKSC